MTLGFVVRFRLHFLFDLHVMKFVGVEDLAAELALNKFDIVFTRHDAHLAVFAGGIHDGGRRKSRLQFRRMGRIVPVPTCERKRLHEDSSIKSTFRETGSTGEQPLHIDIGPLIARWRHFVGRKMTKPRLFIQVDGIAQPATRLQI
jgi:hypothetical protein